MYIVASLMKPHPLTFRSTDVLYPCCERSKGVVSSDYIVASSALLIYCTPASSLWRWCGGGLSVVVAGMWLRAYVRIPGNSIATK